MKEAQSLFISDDRIAVATDLYQLTMMAGYLKKVPEQKAVFELFARRLPSNRACLIVAGLEQAVHYLSNLRFNPVDIAYLKAHPVFKATDPAFFDFLKNFSFTGDLWSVPEGTPIFPDEPIARVTGSIVEAQLVESYLLSIFNAQTLIASKAARIVQAANGKPLYEFGLRRSHGPQAAIYACRAAYIAGFTGTSDVLAANLLGVPVVGTMAHAWVMASENEKEALAEFRNLYEQATLLIDTYDTEKGALLAAETGSNLQAVRIDSGDFFASAKAVRKILDDNGQGQAKIQASGDLNENTIRDLEEKGAPYDVYAIGTDLVVSRDSPSLNIVYKLVAVTDKDGKWRPVAKKSKGKRTIAGAKQICRFTDSKGKYLHDMLTLEDEDVGSLKLMRQIISNGRLVYDLPRLDEIRQYCLKCQMDLGREFFLPGLSDNCSYKVAVSTSLNGLQEKIGVK